VELRHLRYFVAVAAHGSFRRAAAHLHLTQPALSRQVRDLEDELRVVLFARSQNAATLTDTGELFYEEAREVLAAIQAIAPDQLRIPFSDADCMTLIESGAEIKDRERGLVDFPSLIEGVEAYWCWMAGEPAIAWWHPRNTGFAGRKPIDR